MTDHQDLDGTFDPLVLADGDSYRLRGTVYGDCELGAGSSLIHEGLVTGTLSVHAGATVLIRGTSSWTRWEDPTDVEFEGRGHPRPEWGVSVPFVGPPGFTRLDASWQSCVAGIDNAVSLASLEPKFKTYREDVALEAFRAAAAVIVRAGRTDTQLWALLSAAVYNPIENVRVSSLDVWSPYDCRKRLDWPVMRKYFDSPPELFTRLLPLQDRAGRSRAFAYYESISRVLRSALAIEGQPSPDVVEAVERFRTMLRQQWNQASTRRKQRINASPAAASSAAKAKTTPRTTKSRASASGRSVSSRSASSRPGSSRTASNRSRSSRTEPSRSTTFAALGKTRASTTEIPVESEGEPVDTALVELDALIGLENVKSEIRQLAEFVGGERRRMGHGLRVTDITRHLVMTGNPGTGKTTVARLLGRIYAGYQLLDKPTVHEVNRKDLVGEAIGQTEPRVAGNFMAALGGVLFIDEAHDLALGGNDFGRVAINTLGPLMENHRHEIMVVVAGYPEPMSAFLGANPGFGGRFGQTIAFPDYDDSELLAIFKLICSEQQYEPEAEVEAPYLRAIDSVRKDTGANFSNARAVRKIFERTLIRQHGRVTRREKSEGRVASDVEWRELLAEDIPNTEEAVSAGRESLTQ
jgi:SpoVK/Ycf46/Vps4 family AAA+-type ATPase